MGQSWTSRLAVRVALPLGCLILVVGLLLVGASLWVETLPLLVAGAVCGGIGQGLAFRAGLIAVGEAAPPAHRAATVSSFFVVAYTGISLPVVGVGALTMWVGLDSAGLIFTACVTVLATATGLYLARGLREPVSPV